MTTLVVVWLIVAVVIAVPVGRLLSRRETEMRQAHNLHGCCLQCGLKDRR